MDIETKELPCLGKLVFDTKREAEVAAVVARYQRGISLSAYLCRSCRLWHLSSNSTIKEE